MQKFLNKHGSAIVWAGFGVVILSAALLFGFYWEEVDKELIREELELLEDQKIATSTSSKADGVRPEPTEGWKTYRNEKYGFEVRYPVDWQYANSDFKERYNFFQFSKKVNISSSTFDYKFVNVELAVFSGANIFNKFYSSTGKTNIVLDSAVYNNIERLRVGGFPAIRYTAIRKQKYIPIETIADEVMIQRGEDTFRLALYGHDSKLAQDQIVIFDSMLSGLRFFKPVPNLNTFTVDGKETFGWKVLRKPDLGFEIKYPDSQFTIAAIESSSMKILHKDDQSETALAFLNFPRKSVSDLIRYSSEFTNSEHYPGVRNEERVTGLQYLDSKIHEIVCAILRDLSLSEFDTVCPRYVIVPDDNIWRATIDGRQSVAITSHSLVWHGNFNIYFTQLDSGVSVILEADHSLIPSGVEFDMKRLDIDPQSKFFPDGILSTFKFVETQRTERTPPTPSQWEKCDINRDRKCDKGDLLIFEQAVGMCKGDAGYDSSLEAIVVNGRYCIDQDDRAFLFPQLVPEIKVLSYKPTAIVAQDPEIVVVEAKVEIKSALPVTLQTLKLVRLNNDGSAGKFMGLFHDDGLGHDKVARDGIYTVDVELNEPTLEDARMMVAATFRELKGEIYSDSDNKIYINVHSSLGECNADCDLSIFNMGDSMAIGVGAVPEDASRVIVYRATSPTGPWIKAFDVPDSPYLNQLVDAVDGTQGVLYYRAEAYSSSGQLLKSYGIVRVPKYVKE